MLSNQSNTGKWSHQFAQTQSPLIKHWLQKPGALTAGLRKLGTVKLTVLREYASKLAGNEAWMINSAKHTDIWVREIIMSIDEVDCVVARSFTTLTASNGVWAGMRSLQARPLADMLYHDSDITRSIFYSCQLQPKQPLYETTIRAIGQETPNAPLLARCSTFWRQQNALLVAECFLPEFWNLANNV